MVHNKSLYCCISLVLLIASSPIFSSANQVSSETFEDLDLSRFLEDAFDPVDSFVEVEQAPVDQSKVTALSKSVVDLLRGLGSRSYARPEIIAAVNNIQKQLLDSQAPLEQSSTTAATAALSQLATLEKQVQTTSSSLLALNKTLPQRILHITNFDVALTGKNWENFNVADLWGMTKNDLLTTITQLRGDVKGVMGSLSTLADNLDKITTYLPVQSHNDDMIAIMAKLLLLSDIRNRCKDPCDPNPCPNGGTCLRSPSQLHSYACMCLPGYGGPDCAPIIDLCTPTSCANGAKCVNNTDKRTHRCECVDDYIGDRCEKDKDDCSPWLCQNGGKCIDGRKTFTCQCAAGYTGPRCEINIDDCSPNPCKNSPIKCVDMVNNYTCACSVGYTGRNCQINIDDCAGNQCSKNGVCVDGINSYTCRCLVGFDGKFCETNVNDCKVDSCLNNGVCVDGINTYTCKCPAGFSGARCETNINDCKPDSCKNGGVCVDGINTFTCKCAAGWSGPSCEFNINDCASYPCKNDGLCIDGVNKFTCRCLAGYSGANCERVNDNCSPNPCLNSGACKSLVNDFTCTCPYGWRGKKCETRSLLPNCDAVMGFIKRTNTPTSGIFTIQPSCTTGTIDTYCDMTDGWTLAAYADNGALAGTLSRPSSTFDAKARTGAGHIDLPALANRSTVMALAWSTATGGSFSNLESYPSYLTFNIPTRPLTFDGTKAVLSAENSAKCTENYFNQVAISKTKGTDASAVYASQLYSTKNDFTTASRTCFGLVSTPSAQPCNWKMEADAKSATAGYKGIYMCQSATGTSIAGVAYDTSTTDSQGKTTTTPVRTKLTKGTIWLRGNQNPCSDKCLNGGRCIGVCPDTCDCTGTGYTGQFCNVLEAAAPIPRSYSAAINSVPTRLPDGSFKGQIGQTQCLPQVMNVDGCKSTGIRLCEEYSTDCVAFFVDSSTLYLIDKTAFPLSSNAGIVYVLDTFLLSMKGVATK